MKTSIYIATGERIEKFKCENYFPVVVDNARKGFKDVLGDDDGESISEKNPYYCELTVLYWIWKNREDDDFVGLCHYRRFFDFAKINDNYVVKQVNSIHDILPLIDTGIVEKILNERSLILPEPYYLPGNNEMMYDVEHRKSDLDNTIKIVKKLYPEYLLSLDKVLSSNKLYPFNMFVMSRENFDVYMQWLFDILFELEKVVELPQSKYQQRLFGFIAERLFNVYIEKNKAKFNVYECPVLFLDNNTSKTSSIPKNFKYKVEKNYPKVIETIEKIRFKILGVHKR